MATGKRTAQDDLLSAKQATGILSILFVVMTATGVAIPVFLHLWRWHIAEIDEEKSPMYAAYS